VALAAGKHLLLGVVRGEGVEAVLDWLQSTANSVLGWFFAYLATPVYSSKDDEYFCLASHSSHPDFGW